MSINIPFFTRSKKALRLVVFFLLVEALTVTNSELAGLGNSNLSSKPALNDITNKSGGEKMLSGEEKTHVTLAHTANALHFSRGQEELPEEGHKKDEALIEQIPPSLSTEGSVFLEISKSEQEPMATASLYSFLLPTTKISQYEELSPGLPSEADEQDSDSNKNDNFTLWKQKGQSSKPTTSLPPEMQHARITGERKSTAGNDETHLQVLQEKRPTSQKSPPLSGMSNTPVSPGRAHYGDDVKNEKQVANKTSLQFSQNLSESVEALDGASKRAKISSNLQNRSYLRKPPFTISNRESFTRANAEETQWEQISARPLNHDNAALATGQIPDSEENYNHEDTVEDERVTQEISQEAVEDEQISRDEMSSKSSIEEPDFGSVLTKQSLSEQEIVMQKRQETRKKATGWLENLAREFHSMKGKDIQKEQDKTIIIPAETIIQRAWVGKEHRLRGYPPHILDGASYQVHEYGAEILIPIMCGIFGALLIVCIAFACRGQDGTLPRKKRRRQDHSTQNHGPSFVCTSADQNSTTSPLPTIASTSFFSHSPFTGMVKKRETDLDNALLLEESSEDEYTEDITETDGSLHFRI